MDDIERLLRIKAWGTAKPLKGLEDSLQKLNLRALLPDSRDRQVDSWTVTLLPRLWFITNDRDPDEILCQALASEMEWKEAGRVDPSLSKGDLLAKLSEKKSLADVLRSPSAQDALKELQEKDPRAFQRVWKAARRRSPRSNQATTDEIFQSWQLLGIHGVRRRQITELRRLERRAPKEQRLNRPKSRARAREDFWKAWAGGDPERLEMARRMLTLEGLDPNNPQNPDELAACWACDEIQRKALRPAAAVKRVEAARKLLEKRLKDPAFQGIQMNLVQLLRYIRSLGNPERSR